MTHSRLLYNSNNFLIRSDAYKFTHWMQYPNKTEKIYSYLESRGGESESICFFGLQYYLQKYLEGVVVFEHDIEEARLFAIEMFGHDKYFNRAGWNRIVQVHGGKLPIRIRAIDEGTWIGTKNVLLTIENTDPQLPWLTQFVETLLMKVWYPISVSTYSGNIRKNLARYASETGGSVSPFHLNDFGYRGASSEETAAIGGAAHLVHFSGTDTCAGIVMARNYYDSDYATGMSVFATEHSTTTIYGESGELGAVTRFVDTATGIVSIVIDSYNTYRLVDEYIGVNLRDTIMNGNVRVVLRPDSGDPVEQVMYLLNSLERNFPVERNVMNYKILPEYIGIIYGDFMSYEMIDKICQAMKAAGWAIDGRNVVFGMGGNLLQNTNRDTHQFALKCSFARIEGNDVDVRKNPVTMKGKVSKAGRLGLIRDSRTGVFTTVKESESDMSLMPIVFENGRVTNITTFTEIRNRATM